MKEIKYAQIYDIYPHLKFPQKYLGTRPITCRSGWEIKFIIKYLDINPNIISWKSEAEIIQYVCPTDGKKHRYYLDFSFIGKTKDGSTKEFWVEIKPFNQTQPPKEPTRKTKGYIEQVKTYMKNTAKWNTTQKLCEQYKNSGRDITFLILTEKDVPFFKD